MHEDHSGKGKLLRLEAMRGLAAVYVVLHHTIPHQAALGGIKIGVMLRFGQEAVILFFLLSGFVINYSYRLGIDKTFSRYFRNRFLRVYIPLLIVLFLSYLSASYNVGALINIDGRTLIGNIFMLQDWSFARPNVIVDAYMDNGPLWSLSYEWWFYMLYFPIVNGGLSVVARDRLVFLTCLSAAVLYIFHPYYFVRVLMYLSIWWVGVRLADAYLGGYLNKFKNHLLSLSALSAIVLLLLLNVYFQREGGVSLLLGRHPLLEVRHFLFAFIALVVALIIHRVSWSLFDVITRPFLIFSPISYALYIVHVPLASNAEYLKMLSNPYAQWVGYVSVCIIVSYVIELRIYPRAKKRLLSMGGNKSIDFK